MLLSGRNRAASMGTAALLSAAALLVAGCGEKNSKERLEAARKQYGVKAATLFPFAGRVTIDGEPPKFPKARDVVVVVLSDPQKLDVPPKDRLYTTCKGDGTFQFGDDGIPPGKYVVTFAGLLHNKKVGLAGPDLLKNLYNDPEKNGKIPKYTIDHQSPGKSDYVFDLKIEGVDPVKNPGPHAVTEIPD